MLLTLTVLSLAKVVFIDIRKVVKINWGHQCYGCGVCVKRKSRENTKYIQNVCIQNVSHISTNCCIQNAYEMFVYKIYLTFWQRFVYILYTKFSWHSSFDFVYKMYKACWNVVYILYTFCIHQLYTSYTIFVYKMYKQFLCG